VFRIGGDEFAVLLPSVSAAEVETLRTRLRAAFAHTPALEPGVPVSASVGAGFAATGLELGQAFAAADRGVHDEKTRRGLHRA
jgi:GGDEF domain-containing protein